MLRRKENINIEGEQFTFKIFRFDPLLGKREEGASGSTSGSNSQPRFDHFSVIAEKGMTVLDALLNIQERQDPSLVFRYSCRGAICGSCGMVINGKPNLACRTQLSGLACREILIEPLPNLEIIKDLIVNMKPFWKAYRLIEPWLQPGGREAKGEHLVTEKNRAEIDQFVGCVLCACCYGACPVVSLNEKYAGPAALVKLFRFIRDSRDERDRKQAFKRLDNKDGLWACHTVFRCTEDCPKEVRPTDGIEGLRRSAVAAKCCGFTKKKVSKENEA